MWKNLNSPSNTFEITSIQTLSPNIGANQVTKSTKPEEWRLLQLQINAHSFERQVLTRRKNCPSCVCHCHRSPVLNPPLCVDHFQFHMFQIATKSIRSVLPQPAYMVCHLWSYKSSIRVKQYLIFYAQIQKINISNRFFPCMVTQIFACQSATV